MPLVAADLIATPDGTLWFSGLPSLGTPRVSGQGWMGYQLDVETPNLQTLVSDPERHIFSPEFNEQGITWTRGPGADLSARGVPCRGGVLQVVDTDLGPQIGLVDANQRIHMLTWTRAQHASPACDEARGRAWFLSDRDVGVRALRLWWIPLPEIP